MTEARNSAPQPISDEDLDSATGGGIGINPLLLLASGGQGIYAQGTDPAHAPATAGVNPLYVARPHVAEPTAPVVTPVVAHDVAPAPTMTSPGHDYTPPPPPTPVLPPAATPAHDSSTVVIGNSAATGLGQSLDIPSHPQSQVISTSMVVTGNIGPTLDMTIDTTPPPVTTMTFAQNPGGFTQITPTVDPLRSAGYVPHAGTSTPLENAFDLQLVNK